MTDDDILRVIAQRIAVALCVSEHRILGDEVLEAKVDAFRSEAPVGIDPLRMARVLARMLRKVPEPYVVAFYAGVDVGDAEKACRLVDDERRGDPPGGGLS